jgi:hypothetical protein
MSVKSVREQIAAAMQTKNQFEDQWLTKDEAQKIVAEAEKGGVQTAETDLIRKLANNGVSLLEGGAMTAAIPELRGDAFFYGEGSKPVIDSFIARYAPLMMTLAFPENRNDIGQ